MCVHVYVYVPVKYTCILYVRLGGGVYIKHTHVQTCIHTCLRICYVCMYVRMYMCCMCTGVYACTWHVWMYACVHVHVYVYIYVYMYMYMYMYICIHIHSYLPPSPFGIAPLDMFNSYETRITGPPIPVAVGTP